MCDILDRNGGRALNKADIGIIGLAVMGENLALNLLNHGFRVAVYNRNPEKVRGFLAGRGSGKDVVGAQSLPEFVESLALPRKIMLMIRAGSPVDDMLEGLLPLLSPGDIVIDGGNSNFRDTIRRAKYVESRGFNFVGCGVSGGEEGALNGPSLMPGGSAAAWPHLKPLLQAIAANVEGVPCCDWVGADGAGHFVKMVHNGIEYGDMQLIGEAYQIMRTLLNMRPGEIGGAFEKWNKGELDSYLIEITAAILKTVDEDGEPLIDKILDTAGQKGTGKWAVVEALNEGVPLTLIGEAVFARCLSAIKDERVRAASVLKGPAPAFEGDREAFLSDLEHALYAAKLTSYAQGYALLRAAAATNGWELNYGGIALLWRGGCIIRSAFLGRIKEAFDRDPALDNLLIDPYFAEKLGNCQRGLRNVAIAAARNGIPAPWMFSALAYFDGYR
ncbi:MAG: decarboxylating NADP(+)-dependent phosphogluconate dehydrogenase, partial [Clostridiales bacterium]|nr:decarboxylating NADP(+)-dependent phosphogluconate dehydrogenase [Clostridiales bacterium]